VRILPALVIAASLALGVPAAPADNLVIPLEIRMKFHDDVKVKKYISRKWDGVLKVGAIVPFEVEYYDVPDDVVVAIPALKGHKYAYINDKVCVVDSGRKIVAVVN
jgi:hypothetical protein